MKCSSVSDCNLQMMYALYSGNMTGLLYHSLFYFYITTTNSKSLNHFLFK